MSKKQKIKNKQLRHFVKAQVKKRSKLDNREVNSKFFLSLFYLPE